MIIRAYFATLGKIALLIACWAFLTGVGLLVLGGFLSTWPIHRQSPRSVKLRSAVGALEIVVPAALKMMRDASGAES